MQSNDVVMAEELYKMSGVGRKKKRKLKVERFKEVGKRGWDVPRWVNVGVNRARAYAVDALENFVASSELWPVSMVLQGR